MNTYLNNDYYGEQTSNAKTQITSHSWNVGPAGTESSTSTLAQIIGSEYEVKYKWNGKIALLTQSEYMRANTNTSDDYMTINNLNPNISRCKVINWLCNSSGWWLLSPNSNDPSYEFVVMSTYRIKRVYEDGYVRPALYLCSNLKLSGSGIQSDPFTMSGSCSS